MPRTKKVRWTKERPYTIAIQRDITGDWKDYGPFDFRGTAAYAAKVIHGNLEEGKQPAIAIYCCSAMIVEVLGGSNIKPSPHYRAIIADADIYDMSPPDHRAEFDYILASCRNAGANGRRP